MARAGSRRAVDLLPWPDGLEYAAAAINLDQGRGAVLHFGGHSYPSRYPEGYPMLLAGAYPLLGHRVENLAIATIAMGVLAIVALYVVTLGLFGRLGAFVAGLLLATSPVFIANATVVLSDVPALTVVCLAALAIARASAAEEGSPSATGAVGYWCIFAFLCGFAVMLRPTNVALLAGAGAGLLLVPARIRFKTRGRAALALAAVALAFAAMPLWQAWQNLVHLGGPTASGYAYWVPEVYGSLARTFNPYFLFGETMPNNVHGNLPVYLAMILGLDGLLVGGLRGSPLVPIYYLYPLAAAIFALLGLVGLVKSSAGVAARRVVGFGLGFLAALLALYSFYFFTDIVFLLPAGFVLLVLAGAGFATAHRRLSGVFARHRRDLSDHLAVAGVLLLDAMLALAMLTEVGRRLQHEPQGSTVVPALASVAGKLPAGAIVASNISLQFLELYLRGAGREFVGLHSFEADNQFSDYHLHRLYAKRVRGWRGPLPMVLFDGTVVVAGVVAQLAREARAGRPVYLLLYSPKSPEYARELDHEMRALDASFELEPAARAGPLILMRVAPRDGGQNRGP